MKSCFSSGIPVVRNFDHQIGTYRYYFKNDFLFSGWGGTSADQYAVSLDVQY